MNKKSKILSVYVYLFSLGGIMAWLGLIILAPYLKSKASSLSEFCYTIFSPICHQIPSRSFFLFGHPLAVCGRCLGVFIGFFSGTLLYPFLRKLSTSSIPKVKTLVLISIPIVVDTAANFFHFWATPNLIRFIIGVTWGVILPFYFITGITDLVLCKKKKT